jgi:hypothetical protein
MNRSHISLSNSEHFFLLFWIFQLPVLAGPDVVKKIIWDIWCQALEVSEEVRWFPITRFLMGEQLSHVLFT